MIVINSSYRKPFFFSGEHLETALPNIFRKVKLTPTNIERITTPDQDFLDLDWYKSGSKTLIIVSHGLEGSSESQYVKGMSKYMQGKGFDVLAWNYRGCSGEINKTKRFYHSGATYDLETVITHALTCGYKKIALIGFSLGGNLTLKYMGENTPKRKEIKTAIGISVPIDLSAGCDEISKPKNKMYTKRFLIRLRKKLRAKNELLGDSFPLNGINSIKNLRTFDDMFTGPLHGFKNADDYYKKSSALFYLNSIETPTLIINAKNDPFLPKECYPYQLLENHPTVWLETPDHGGHVGFSPAANDGSYWTERRAFEFIKENLY